MSEPDFQIFELTDVTPKHVFETVAKFTDKSFASAFFDRALMEMRKGTFPTWIGSVAPIAAHALGRLGEALPFYEEFLRAQDSQSKPDWHANFTKYGLDSNDLFQQSGRLGQNMAEFDDEFQRVTRTLGPPQLGRVLDIGCGGGLWTISLAKLGYQVTGTDHHRGVIDAASATADRMGVAQQAAFICDDICSSTIPTGTAARAICLGVTPTLSGVTAFRALIAQLDRVSRAPTGQSVPRRVILGQNRWGPSRMDAVREIFEQVGLDYVLAVKWLNLLTACWWLQPEHIEIVRDHFEIITLISETRKPCDGIRTEYLLQ